MSTKAEIWLNGNNDQDAFQIPVNPEDIKMSYKGQATSIKVDGFGEIFHKGKRDACVISFSSFFPGVAGGYCAYSPIPRPLDCHNKIVALMESSLPVHFVYCNSSKVRSIDIYAYISSYSAQEKGGDPDTLHYTIELKEMRGVVLRTIQNGRVVTESVRPGNATNASVHAVAKGETLYKIAKKLNKKKANQVKNQIINLNKTTLSSWNASYKKANKKGKKNYVKDGKYKLLIGGILTLP